MVTARMKGLGRRLWLRGGLLATVAVFASATAADAHGRVNTCAVFHANALGHHQPWRGYKTGKVSCGATTAILDAVLHGRGKVHMGSDSEDSYIRYHGWKCGLEQMGLQLCWRPPRRSLLRATAAIVALDCSIMEGCPRRYPSENPI